jgi:hypothetical protein
VKARFSLLFAAFCLFFASSARADEVAPALEGSDLRTRADMILRSLIAAKPEPKLRGLYAAFDPSVTDPIAQVACDDDGDYVIVVSDAMLRVLSYASRVKSPKEYAQFLASTQRAGHRVMPPPANTEAAQDGAEERWTEMMRFLYASELARLRAGDLVCAHPTATKERGDDEWTPAEQRTAAEAARTIYPTNQPARDATAILEVGDVGARALLGFFSWLGHEQWTPTYLVLHPRKP